MQRSEITPDTILDTALKLAVNQHWEALRLHDIALDLNVSLVELHQHITEKEDLIDLLWDRADRYMLANCQGTDFEDREFTEQFEHCVMNWLDCLAPHQNTVLQMIQVRLEPGHLHIQLPTLFRISRTVQWMRECCGREATFLKRASEEVVLSTIFITTASFWLTDNSQNTIRTRQYLTKAIHQAVRLEKFWPDNN